LNVGLFKSIAMDLGFASLPSQVKEHAIQSAQEDGVFDFAGLCHALQHVRFVALVEFRKTGGFCSSDLDQFRRIFDRHDTQKEGRISKRQLNNALSELDKLPRTPEQQLSLVKLIDRLDSDGSGFMEWEEFLQLLRIWTNEALRCETRQALSVGAELGFQADEVEGLRNAFVGHASDKMVMTLRQAVVFVREHLGATITPKMMPALRKILKECSGKEDGELDFPTFLRVMRVVKDEMAKGIFPIEE